jgi:predicted enzyme related to lactoylglutathione lyase
MAGWLRSASLFATLGALWAAAGPPPGHPQRSPESTRKTSEGMPMIAGAKYGHTNLIAKDWRSLARFYQDLFGCTPVPPERDFKGHDLERGTGIPGAELRGVHLRLPGHGAEGPTLEIFNYNVLEEKPDVAVNRPGFGHIAFVVDDVPEARAAVLAAGGRPVGEVVTLTTAAGTRVTWVYVTDPEGNVLELQSWSK